VKNTGTEVYPQFGNRAGHVGNELEQLVMSEQSRQFTPSDEGWRVHHYLF
jgi:hypothetical protein